MAVTDGITIGWSGVVTGGQPVTVTFRAATAAITQPWAIVNCAFASRSGAPATELAAFVILNGRQACLPTAWR